MPEKRLVYDLPSEGSPDVWGKYYWDAFNDLAHNIPCGECAEETKTFLSFYHDYVNKKLEKPVFDEQNYNNWKNKINMQQRLTDTESMLLALFIIGAVSLVAYFAIIKRR